MRKKRIIVLIAELLFIILIIGGVFLASRSIVKETDVYVFARDIPCGTVISYSDITTDKIPQGAINDNFVFKKDSIVGKMAGVNIKKGDYVLASYLIENTETAYTYEDLAKLRKVSFSVSLEDGLAGCVGKGDIVDLVYTGRQQNMSTGQEFTYSNTFLEGVYVWGVHTSDGHAYSPTDPGYNDESSFAGKETTSIDTSGDYGELAMITVMVTPSQAAEIEARKSTGTISLLGRFSNAENTPNTGFVINNYTGVYVGNEDPEKIAAPAP